MKGGRRGKLRKSNNNKKVKEGTVIRIGKRLSVRVAIVTIIRVKVRVEASVEVGERVKSVMIIIIIIK